MHGAAYVGVRPCHHKHSYSTNPPGFIEYRKLKTWLHSSLVDSWLKYVNCILFSSTEAKKESKQSYESELFSSLINTNKAAIAHHCCFQDLV